MTPPTHATRTDRPTGPSRSLWMLAYVALTTALITAGLLPLTYGLTTVAPDLVAAVVLVVALPGLLAVSPTVARTTLIRANRHVTGESSHRS